jgi:hypothetical protein
MADEAFVALFSAQTGLNSGAVIARVRTYLGHAVDREPGSNP